MQSKWRFVLFSKRKWSLDTVGALCRSMGTTRSAATLLGFTSFSTVWPGTKLAIFCEIWHFFSELVLCAPTGSGLHLWLIGKVLSCTLWFWRFRILTAHFSDFWKNEVTLCPKTDTRIVDFRKPLSSDQKVQTPFLDRLGWTPLNTKGWLCKTHQSAPVVLHTREFRRCPKSRRSSRCVYMLLVFFMGSIQNYFLRF